MISPVYLLATKLEAFNDRGNNDFLANHDLEDILTLVNGREELISEANYTRGQVRKFICTTLRSLLSNPSFLESVPGHLNPEPDRFEIVVDRLKRIAAY